MKHFQVTIRAIEIYQLSIEAENIMDAQETAMESYDPSAESTASSIEYSVRETPVVTSVYNAEDDDE